MTNELFDRLSAALIRTVAAGQDVEPHLRAALQQVAAQPGKLVRAGLVHEAARRFGLRRGDAERLACAVEYFHVASLVLDDLPCMDDATLRRGLPCVHRQHGEATAILTSLTLINRAYALLHTALAAQSRRVRAEAVVCADRALGLAGLVGGQAWDLAFADSDRTARRVSRIAAAKTGALFTLAVMLPATLGRPTPVERRTLRALCVYWGQLFQIADDMGDVLTTSYESGKTSGRDRALQRPNLVLALGLPAARARVARLRRQAARALAALRAEGGSRWTHLQEVGKMLEGLLVVTEQLRTAA